MTTLLVSLVMVVSCGIGQTNVITATSADDASTMVFFVGDSKTQKMLPNVKLLLVSDGAPASDIGTTDLNGQASVPLSRLRLSGSRVVLFCRDGYFCGAIRVDESSFFEYREHFIQLAPFAFLIGAGRHLVEADQHERADGGTLSPAEMATSLAAGGIGRGVAENAGDPVRAASLGLKDAGALRPGAKRLQNIAESGRPRTSQTQRAAESAKRTATYRSGKAA